MSELFHKFYRSFRVWAIAAFLVITAASYANIIKVKLPPVEEEAEDESPEESYSV